MNITSVLSLFPIEIVISIKTILFLVIADFLLGIIASIKTKEFNVKKLPQFLINNIFPYVGGLLVLALLSQGSKEIEILFFGAAGTTTVMFINDLKNKVIIIFGNITNSN